MWSLSLLLLSCCGYVYMSIRAAECHRIPPSPPPPPLHPHPKAGRQVHPGVTLFETDPSVGHRYCYCCCSRNVLMSIGMAECPRSPQGREIGGHHGGTMEIGGHQGDWRTPGRYQRDRRTPEIGGLKGDAREIGRHQGDTRKIGGHQGDRWTPGR